jgi:rRNA processing protein Krr1/Pno1
MVGGLASRLALRKTAETLSQICHIHRSVGCVYRVRRTLPSARQILLRGCYCCNAFADLRERHIHVHFDVLRRSKEFRLRGLRDDLQLAKQDLLRIEVCTKVLSLPAKSTAALIGKEGSTINILVDQNQAAVTVPSKDGKTPASKVDVVIIGPSKNVEAASLAIHAILNGHMEASQTVIIDSNLKASLKMNRGEGIKELFKTVNDRFREEAEGVISVSFGEDGIVLKCKAKVLPEVVTFIETEICRLEGCTLRVEVDTFVLPAVLGKGGKGIQELSQGTRGVHVHVNRGTETSTILISGWKPDDVPKVRAALKEVLQNNVVRRIGLGDSCATPPPSLRAMKSTLTKELKQLVFFIVDEEKSELVLRGTEDALKEAATIIHQYFSESFVEKKNISNNHAVALLHGGKVSKVAKLAIEFNIHLSADKEEGTLVAQGPEANVKEALSAVDRFLSESSLAADLCVTIRIDTP